MPARSRSGSRIVPSRHRRSPSRMTAASPNRSADIPTGGSTSSAAFTTMKLLPHTSITPSTPISARRRSRSVDVGRPDMETPAGRPAGVASAGAAAVVAAAPVTGSAISGGNGAQPSEVGGGAPRRRPPEDGGAPRRRPPASDRFLVELQSLFLGLLGQLEPQEEPGQHDERNDDERGEGDAECNGDRLEGFHAIPPGQAPVAAGAPGMVWGWRRARPRAIISAMSSRVNSARVWRDPA